MTNSLIVLTSTYVFGLFVLLLLLIRSRLALKTRLSVVLAGSAFYLIHFFSLNTLQGWPSQSLLPEEFTLHAWQAEEPNSAQNRAGQIYLWVQTQEWEAPRAYALPYSNELHDRLDTARARHEEGYTQQGQIDGRGSATFSDAPRRLPLKTDSSSTVTKD
ncbi:MAG: hypothetical protein CL401_07510 [Acidiferrobacteraceae bacterium]|nr:hypothetical protein [Acidiferrobacteraceae bacterium]